MEAVFVQRDEKSAKAKAAADLVRSFQPRFTRAMEIFEAGIDDVLSYLHYPQPHRVRISSTNRWSGGPRCYKRVLRAPRSFMQQLRTDTGPKNVVDRMISVAWMSSRRTRSCLSIL